MTSLEVLTAQQREISEIASTLRSMLSGDRSGVAGLDSVTRLLLCDLCRKVRGHLVEEDEELYPDLMVHADLQIRHLAWGLRSGDRSLCHRFEEFHRRWLKGCDSEFTGELLQETRALLDEIEQRIDREQRVMFPQLQDWGIFATTLH